MTDPLILAKFVDEQINELEQKISQVVETYDRESITNSLIKVLGNVELSYDKFITGYKELGLIESFYNLLMAEISRDDGDLITALKYVAEGNFDIGRFYGGMYIARKQRQDASKNNYSGNRLIKSALIEYWQENRSHYELRGNGGRLQAAEDFKKKGGYAWVAPATMKDWLKNK